MDALHRLDVLVLVAALRAGDDSQALLAGQLGGLDHDLDPRRTDGHGLLHENVLALPDRLGKLFRPKPRRGRQNNQVDIIERHQLLVGVDTDEATVVRDLEIGLEFLHPVRKRVRQSDYLHAGRRLHAVVCGARAPSAAADDADANLIAASREGQRTGRARDHQGTGRCR